MLRKRMVWPTFDWSEPMPWTWSAMMPRGVRSSTMSAHGTPFSQVRMDVPMASTRNLFHSPLRIAFCASFCPSSVCSQPRRASS